MTQKPKKNQKHTGNCPADRQDRCCVITIHRLVQREPGIHEVIWDTVEREIEVAYEPDMEHDAELNYRVKNLARRVEQGSAACHPNEDCGENCSAIPPDLGKGIEYADGVFHIHEQNGAPDSDRKGPQSPWVRRKLKIHDNSEAAPREASGRDGADAAADAEAKTAATGTAAGTQEAQGRESGTEASRDKTGLLAQLSDGLNQVPWEPLFVAITLAAMIAGAITERIAPGLLPWLLYGVAYITGGFFGLRASIASLKARKIDIDLLMVLAAISAAAVGSPFEGALLLFLFSLSNVLQDFALDRTRSAIKSLSELRPDTALVVDSPESAEGRPTSVKDVKVGDFVQVKPGNRIPLDGVIVRGASSIDQSSITGESLPVEKSEGEEVLSGTINQDGEFVLRVTKTTDESTISRVITLVEEAREKQARTERFMEGFEQYYAMGVIAATILAALVPPVLLGMEWEISVYRAITLMVAASPCALIISTPASILSSIGNGARRGILFKGGVHVEQAARIQAIAFDKTGTLTEGKPHVEDIISLSDWSERDLLSAAASIESKSEHVIAEAVVRAAEERELQYSMPKDFRSQSGVGVRGMVNDRELLLGSPSLLDRLGDGIAGVREARDTVLKLQKESKTVIVLVENAGQKGSDDLSQARLLGLISLMDRLRPGVREVIQDLRDIGIKHIAMLTGDNEAAAQAIAAEAGIDAVFPELLPEHKLDAIRRIEEQYGFTAMIGDGVNDAPAMAGARLGIAMGAAGTDVALETADIVLMSDDLRKIPYLMALSRQTRRTLVINISIAMGLILMMVAGIYTIDLPLPLAVIGHEGGTVLVSLNGVRLLLFKR